MRRGALAAGSADNIQRLAHNLKAVAAHVSAADHCEISLWRSNRQAHGAISEFVSHEALTPR